MPSLGPHGYNPPFNISLNLLGRIWSTVSAISFLTAYGRFFAPRFFEASERISRKWSLDSRLSVIENAAAKGGGGSDANQGANAPSNPERGNRKSERLGFTRASVTQPRGTRTMLAHNVFFTLKDASDEAQDRLINSGKEFLSGHPGTTFFSIGKLVPDLDRPVNDLDFHVALHVVFDGRESHDQYQVAQRHLDFIEANKENWEKVRVFDSSVTS